MIELNREFLEPPSVPVSDEVHPPGRVIIPFLLGRRVSPETTQQTAKLQPAPDFLAEFYQRDEHGDYNPAPVEEDTSNAA